MRLRLSAWSDARPATDREPTALERHSAAPDLAPRRAARPRGVRVRRLARGGGPVVVAGAAARAAGRVRLALQGVVGVRGLARAARRAQRAGLAPTSSRRSSPRHALLDRATGRRFAGRGAIADQVRFEREWGALRAYAAERGVRLIGDVPIYVAPDGADHRAHPELFHDGVVAGVPPGRVQRRPGSSGATRSTTGRRTARAATAGGSSASAARSSSSTSSRIDHFRGFVAYWAIPGRPETAREGALAARRPARAASRAVEAELGELPVIAEDLGVITPAVKRLRDELGLPGHGRPAVRLRRRPDNPHRPENHRENQRRLHRHARQRHRRRLVAGR